jgi:dTDP-4-dehydrorhamnose reductase
MPRHHRSHHECKFRLPLLITGVAGVPGYNAWRYFRTRYPGQVYGMRQTDNTRVEGPDIIACNSEDRDGLARVFDEFGFGTVLNCAGNCHLKACELDPPLARRINIEGVENLLAQTKPRGLRLVHLSVDLVYSGLRDGGYIETDRIDPVTMYGKTMAEGEQRVLATDPAATVFRISLPMGISLSGHAGAIDWITSRFKKGRPATLYIDELRTPTYTDCMNRLYDVALGRDLPGLFHAGGPRRLTLFQIGQIINRVGGYDPDTLHGIPRLQAGPIPPRAGNVCMDSGKLIAAMGYQPFDPWPWHDDLVPTDDDWHRRRDVGEAGSPTYLHEILCRNPRRAPAHCKAGTPSLF